MIELRFLTGGLSAGSAILLALIIASALSVGCDAGSEADESASFGQHVKVEKRKMALGAAETQATRSTKDISNINTQADNEKGSEGEGDKPKLNENPIKSRIEFLTTVLNAEERDEAWLVKAEGDWQVALKELLKNDGEVKDITCKTTICLVKLQIKSRMLVNKLPGLLRKRELLAEDGFWAHRRTTNGILMYIFAPRSGHELPRDNGKLNNRVSDTHMPPSGKRN